MNKIKGTVGDFMAAIFLVALIFLLVKPKSPAADAVKAFGDAMIALTSAVTSV